MATHMLVPAERQQTVADFLKKHEAVLQRGLASVRLTPARLVSLVLTQCALNPKLYLCTPASLVRGAVVAAQLGLELDGQRAIAWLIPYDNTYMDPYTKEKFKRLEAQFQIGYQGLKQLAMRSGRIRNIEAVVVREGDEFKIERGDRPRLTHVPALKWPMAPTLMAAPEDKTKDTEADRAARVAATRAVAHWRYHHGPPITHVYAVAWIRDHEFAMFEVLPWYEVERLKAMNRSEEETPAWTNAAPMMGCVKALRVLCKQLPWSADDPALARAHRAAFADERGDLGLPVLPEPTGDAQTDAVLGITDVVPATVPPTTDAVVVEPTAPAAPPEAPAAVLPPDAPVRPTRRDTPEQREQKRTLLRKAKDQQRVRDRGGPPPAPLGPVECSGCGDRVRFVDADGRCDLCEQEAAGSRAGEGLFATGPAAGAK